MRDFKKLMVWEKAHQLTLKVYAVTKDFPGEERFGLTDQVRRSAASIPANIAEGCGRDGDREFARFLVIAAGSASETEYHLLLARDLGLLPADIHRELDELVNQVKKMPKKMLTSLTRKLKSNR